MNIVFAYVLVRYIWLIFQNMQIVETYQIQLENEQKIQILLKISWTKKS